MAPSERGQDIQHQRREEYGRPELRRPQGHHALSRGRRGKPDGCEAGPADRVRAIPDCLSLLRWRGSSSRGSAAWGPSPTSRWTWFVAQARNVRDLLPTGDKTWLTPNGASAKTASGSRLSRTRRRQQHDGPVHRRAVAAVPAARLRARLPPTVEQPTVVGLGIQLATDRTSHVGEELFGQSFARLTIAPVCAEHGFSPRETRWAMRRATAARQQWSALNTWLRKTQSVTSGV